jgi:hypothetical protein
MGSSDDISFITKQHDRLLRIAFFSNIFAWIALVFQILYTVMMFLVYEIPSMINNVTNGTSSETSKVFGSLVGYLIHPNSGLINTLLNGIIYFLVLKGISAGLNMIVETDLNYKEKSIEVDNVN